MREDPFSGCPNRGKAAPEGGAPSWQTAYCSLALIMVVVFVMLISYSTFDRGEMKKFGRSLKTEAHSEDSPQPSVPPGRPLPVQQWSAAALKQRMAALGIADDVIIEKTTRGCKAIMAGHVLFATGSAALSVKKQASLDEMARFARQTGARVWIEGHADGSGFAGADDWQNWSMSSRRAVSVFRYFLERGGIPAERMGAAGYGSNHPLVPNGTADGRERNRRIEITFSWDTMPQSRGNGE
jgi:flagellar motor protein MotB